MAYNLPNLQATEPGVSMHELILYYRVIYRLDLILLSHHVTLYYSVFFFLNFSGRRPGGIGFVRDLVFYFFIVLANVIAQNVINNKKNEVSV